MREYGHANWSKVVRGLYRGAKRIKGIGRRKLKTSETVDRVEGEVLENHSVYNYDSTKNS